MLKRIVALLLVFSLLLTPVRAEDAVEARTVPETSGSQVGAEAAIIMEAQTGRVLFSQNIHERLPIASTTKIMTALIALEQQDIYASFPVDENAIMVEGSSMGLQKGDQVSLRDLAVGMLLASGNDGANAAAIRIAGSFEAFAKIMNQRAAALNMKDTSFETPSGLDGQEHYSTAYDMALLTREALSNPDFVSICSQYRMRASYGNPPYDRWLTNHNKLLNYYEGTIGVKTGFTKKAGRCLVSAVQRDGITLICVTLDCPSDWAVHQGLYDRYYSELKIRDLAAGVPAVNIPVTGGTAPAVSVTVYESANVPVPIEGAKIDYKIKAEQFLYAPVPSGAYAGDADIYLDGEKVFTLSLITSSEVPLLTPYKEKKSLGERIASLWAD